MEIRIINQNNFIEVDKTLQLRQQILRKPLGLNLFDENLGDEKNQVMIACFEADECIGCVLLKPISKRVLKLRQMAVSTNVQKQGVGTEIVKFAMKYAKTNNYTEIELHARKTAVLFYEKLNFETLGNEFLEVGLPHYKMKLKI